MCWWSRRGCSLHQHYASSSSATDESGKVYYSNGSISSYIPTEAHKILCSTTLFTKRSSEVYVCVSVWVVGYFYIYYRPHVFKTTNNKHLSAITHKHRTFGFSIRFVCHSRKIFYSDEPHKTNRHRLYLGCRNVYSHSVASSFCAYTKFVFMLTRQTHSSQMLCRSGYRCKRMSVILAANAAASAASIYCSRVLVYVCLLVRPYSLSGFCFGCHAPVPINCVATQ